MFYSSILSWIDADSLCRGEQGEKSEGDIKVYTDQIHGFALRGDWSSEKDKKAMDVCSLPLLCR